MSNSTFYVCYSPSGLTCGAAHASAQKAKSCSNASGNRSYGRTAYAVDSSSLGDARLSAAHTWGFLASQRRAKIDWCESKGSTPRTGSIPPTSPGIGSPNSHPLDSNSAAMAGEHETSAMAGSHETSEFVGRSDRMTDGRSISNPHPAKADAEALALAEALIALKGSQGALDVEAVNALIETALAKSNDPSKTVLTVQALPANGEGPPKDLGLAHKALPVLLKEMKRGNNALLCGEAGSGKTHGAEQAAKALGRECFLIPQVLDAFTDVSGYMDATGKFVETPLYKWAKASAGAVLILDEMDGSDPNALLRANSLLAGGGITFPNGEYVKVPTGHVVIGCVNTWGNGPTAEYMGRAPLDGASLDRFPSKLSWGIDGALETAIVTDGLDGDEKSAALQTVNVSQRIRENLATYGIRLTWGPRNTIALVKRVVDGDTLAEALEVSSLAQLDDSQRANALTGVSL